MGWVRLDDAFYDHPGHATLPLEAWGLWVWSLAWSNRNLTDGKIPVAVVKRMDPDGKASGALIGAGRWDADEQTVIVHDYLAYQPSAATIREKREREKARWQRRGGSATTPAGVEDPSAATPRGVVPEDAATPNVPTKESLSTTEKTARKRAPTRDFVPTDEHRAYAATHGLALEDELDRWLTWCEANGKVYVRVNAGLSTWLQQAVTFGRGSKPALLEKPAPGPPLPRNDHCLTCGRRLELCEGHDIGQREVTPMFKAGKR